MGNDMLDVLAFQYNKGSSIIIDNRSYADNRYAPHSTVLTTMNKLCWALAFAVYAMCNDDVHDLYKK